MTDLPVTRKSSSLTKEVDSCLSAARWAGHLTQLGLHHQVRNETTLLFQSMLCPWGQQEGNRQSNHTMSFQSNLNVFDVHNRASTRAVRNKRDEMLDDNNTSNLAKPLLGGRRVWTDVIKGAQPAQPYGTSTRAQHQCTPEV